MSEGFILHGTIVYSRDPEHLEECPDSYLICRNGYSEGVYRNIPEEFQDYPVEDFWDKLIIPGMMDLYCEAPAYQVRGMNLDWNDQERQKRKVHLSECKDALEDETTAERAYDMLIDSLYIGTTTRAVLIGTDSTKSVLKLMDLADESGLISCVGKEKWNDIANPEEMADWINTCGERYDRTSPILPLPSITGNSREEFRTSLSVLSEIVKETGLPTCLNFENLPKKESDRHTDIARLAGQGLIGNFGASEIVYDGGACSDQDLDVFLKQGAYLVFCPQNELYREKHSDQAALLRHFMQKGLNAGLGTGFSAYGTSMTEVIKEAIFASRIRSGQSGQNVKPLTLEEAFYLATAGGGSFFGNCGSFEKGNQFDAIVLDDQLNDTLAELSPRDRLERMIYLSDDRNVVGKYVFGDKLY